MLGGAGKAIGAGILGFITFKTGEEVIAAADPREAGKIVGVTFKDVLLISAGAKASQKILRTKNPAEITKARENALESERLKRLGLGKKSKIETVGVIEETQIRKDIIRNIDDENLIKLVKKSSIGKVKRFNVKTKKFDERIILRSTARVDGFGRETTITFRQTKTGRLLKPRVLITDLKSGESLLLRPATPRELKTFEVGGIRVQEIDRLKIEKVLLGKGSVKVAEVKFDDKTIRLLEKKGIVFQIGGRGRGTLSTADLQRLGKTPLVIKNIKPIPVAKLSSIELQALQKGKGITLEAGISEQIPKPLDIKVKKIRPIKSFADEIESLVKPKKVPAPKIKKIPPTKVVEVTKPLMVGGEGIQVSRLKDIPAITPESLGFTEQIITIPGLPTQPTPVFIPKGLPKGVLLPSVTAAPIEIQTSAEIDKTITRLRQEQELKLKERTKLVSVTPTALDLLGVSQLTKQQQRQQQKQLQKLLVRPRLTQRQLQQPVQISDVAQTFRTAEPPPEPPKIIIPPSVRGIEEPIKPMVAKQPGFWPKAQPINTKKFVKLTKVPVTQRQAEDIAAFLVDNSLSTNWRIEKANRFAKQPKIDIPTGYFDNTRTKWRDFKIRKGEKIPTPNSYIERKGLPRLDTFAEINNIQLLRALKQLQTTSSVRRKQVKKLRGGRKKVITLKDLQKQQPQQQKAFKEEDLFAPIEFPSIF